MRRRWLLPPRLQAGRASSGRPAPRAQVRENRRAEGRGHPREITRLRRARSSGSGRGPVHVRSTVRRAARCERAVDHRDDRRRGEQAARSVSISNERSSLSVSHSRIVLTMKGTNRNSSPSVRIAGMNSDDADEPAQEEVQHARRRGHDDRRPDAADLARTERCRASASTVSVSTARCRRMYMRRSLARRSPGADGQAAVSCHQVRQPRPRAAAIRSRFSPSSKVYDRRMSGVSFQRLALRLHQLQHRAPGRAACRCASDSTEARRAQLVAERAQRAHRASCRS